MKVACLQGVFLVGKAAPMKVKEEITGENNLGLKCTACFLKRGEQKGVNGSRVTVIQIRREPRGFQE